MAPNSAPLSRRFAERHVPAAVGSDAFRALVPATSPLTCHTGTSVHREESPARNLSPVSTDRLLLIDQ